MTEELPDPETSLNNNNFQDNGQRPHNINWNIVQLLHYDGEVLHGKTPDSPLKRYPRSGGITGIDVKCTHLYYV